MQEVISIKKVQAIVAAAVLAAIMALGMSIGAQQAFAEAAMPYDTPTKITVGDVEYTFVNKTSNPGVSLKAVKELKKISNIKVPAKVTYEGMQYNVGQIESKAFKGTKAKTITLPATVKKIKKTAFKGAAATKLVLKTKKLKKSSVKKSLKGSKIKVVKSPKGKKTAYKKIFTKKNAGKKVKVK